ncbi:high affinity cAMP-specific and IBMX-insensitive 3',5'-cyclic phosphodiesterase 8A-like isoform X2 [Portunus trituberculatus]|uniref:high affinity cAMP-specific and IBMX-insensitive 3',5'-cyclic phosphodiesterase 8A-like isoform X2 n=1 Tax=Portunus trituberculatus TaxID=210409 RepID=UPI001E1CE04F|nr:high affinity cAMP-specific and IBMX-insensitive 3',5'-cyclic phosphodiesterase 8A-like isoform X2 [Portunus trituberculatus]
MGCAPSLHVSTNLSKEEEEEEEVGGGGGGGGTHTQTNVQTHIANTVSANHQTSSNTHLGPGSRQQVTHAWDDAPQSMRLVTGGLASQLGLIKNSQRHLKVLLVFGKEDSIYQTWKTAVTRRGHSHTLSRTLEEAVRVAGEEGPEVVVVDARPSRGLNAKAVCGAVRQRQTETGYAPVLVAVVKKSFADRDSATVGPMLSAGFNRVVTESSAVGVVLNELVQVEVCDVAGQARLRGCQALLGALDACRELVHITDTHHNIMFINKACENILGYTMDEVAERNLWELHTSDVNKQDGRQTDHHRPSLEFRQVPPQALHDATPTHRPIQEQDKPIQPDSKVPLEMPEAVNSQMKRGKEWEGVVTYRRRSGGALHLPSKVIPVMVPLTKHQQHYIYVSDTHALDRLELSAANVDHFHPRGSIKSLRKGSHDIRSLSSDGVTEAWESVAQHKVSSAQEKERFSFSRPAEKKGPQGIIRRQSLVKLHSLTIEAPITRVFSIISAAQENSPAYVAQALERAIEILRSTELYSPQLIPSAAVETSVSRSVAADPVATDLLGGLLAQGPKPLLSARRSSNDTAVKATQQLPRSSIPVLHQQASSAIRELLAEDMSWSFDIFKLERISDKRPLVWLGMSLLCRFDVPDTLGCDENTLQNWLTLIEANYHSDNTYHNSTHAADVLQSTAYFLSKERIKQLLDPLDVAACLVAAVVHDVDHPGKNSAFLCNTNNELAILYNDLSVLESHHVAVSFKHTRSDERVNIFKALDRDTYKHLRKSIVDMVLATDMTKHFEHVSKFVNMAGCSSGGGGGGGGGGDDDDDGGVFEDDPSAPPDLLSFGSPENIIIIKRMLIKCADVSNPLRPLPLSIDWAYRIANEYFNQTEEEKQRSLPIVMAQFDRTTCSIPKSQIGFIDFFINDMFDAWDALADIPELLEYLRMNYLYWKEEEERSERASTYTPSPHAPPPSPPLSPPTEDGNIKEEEEEEEEEQG